MVAGNKNLSGQRLDDYMDLNFYDLWDQYDVLEKGTVEIEQMASFYKKLLKDMTVDI